MFDDDTTTYIQCDSFKFLITAMCACANESQDVLRGAEAVKPTDHEVEQS